MEQSGFTAPPFPSSITLSITNVCQQRCRFCGYNHLERKNGAGRARHLSPDVVRKMTWMRHVRRICLCGNGEVLAHPKYAEILSIVREIAPESKILIYTNGRALFGKNLDATMKHADSIHISQNAILKKTYDAVIHDGNYELAMDNLRRVSETNWRHIPVKLSFVLLRETINDIVPAIRLAGKYKFNIVRLLYPREPENVFYYTLKQESFNIGENFDIERYKEIAKREKILLEYTHPSKECPQNCIDPFSHIQFTIKEDGNFYLHYCCNGNPCILIREESLASIEKVWNNDRISFIRKTVNNPELLPANTMCLQCRMIGSLATDEQRRSFFKKFNIAVDANNKPIHFRQLVVD